MKGESKVSVKRDRDPEDEEDGLGGGNKRVKMPGCEISDDSTTIDSTIGSRSAPAEKDERGSARVFQPTKQAKDESQDKIQLSNDKPNPKTKRQPKPKKPLPPPSPPALEHGAAFFEPGCPSIGCFLPAKTKGTRRPEKKDMVWTCHWDGCDKINWSLYRLNRHIKEKHTLNKFWICQKEGQAFASKEEFDEHQREMGHVNTEMGRR